MSGTQVTGRAKLASLAANANCGPPRLPGSGLRDLVSERMRRCSPLVWPSRASRGSEADAVLSPTHSRMMSLGPVQDVEVEVVEVRVQARAHLLLLGRVCEVCPDLYAVSSACADQSYLSGGPRFF